MNIKGTEKAAEILKKAIEALSEMTVTVTTEYTKKDVRE